ncbi:hypothetical protein YC2023_020155 [Brassica napus]
MSARPKLSLQICRSTSQLKQIICSPHYTKRFLGRIYCVVWRCSLGLWSFSSSSFSPRLLRLNGDNRAYLRLNLNQTEPWRARQTLSEEVSKGKDSLELEKKTRATMNAVWKRPLITYIIKLIVNVEIKARAATAAAEADQGLVKTFTCKTNL